MGLWLTIYEPGESKQADAHDAAEPDLEQQPRRNEFLRDGHAHHQQGHDPTHQLVDRHRRASGTLVQVHGSCSHANPREEDRQED